MRVSVDCGRCVSPFTYLSMFLCNVLAYIVHFNRKPYSFKCHREPIQGTTTTNVYTINSISTHPKHGTFATRSSDGSFQFWAKDRKCRLKEYSKVGGPITATAFIGNRALFAYSVTYDWSMRYAFNGPEKVEGVRVHGVFDEEVSRRGVGSERLFPSGSLSLEWNRSNETDEMPSWLYCLLPT